MNFICAKNALLVIMLVVYTIAIGDNKIITESSDMPDDVPIFDIEGKKHYLDEFSDKTLLIVFWAPWSSSAEQLLWELDCLKKDFKKLTFDVIAVSEDYRGISRAQEFYNLHGIRYLQVFHDPQNVLFKACGAKSMPTSFLVAKNGKKIMSFVGHIKWHDEEIRQKILAYMPGEIEYKNSYKDKSLHMVVTPSKKKPEQEQNK